jgi:hypothetical protein
MLFCFILLLIFSIDFSLSAIEGKDKDKDKVIGPNPICDLEPNIRHASYRCSGARVHSTCDYTCDSGYGTTTGSRSGSIKCNDYNSWGTADECIVEECASPPDIPNAKLSAQCSHMKVNEYCPITCERGYEAKGSTMNATCIGPNQWDTRSVNCEQIPNVRQFLLNICYSDILKIISKYLFIIIDLY